MPVPEPKILCEWQQITDKILNRILKCEPLSMFDLYCYGKLAKESEKSCPDGALQMRGLLALVQDDENSFNSCFLQAIEKSSYPDCIKANYAYVLAIYGDYERAETVIRELLHSPDKIIRHGLLFHCLKCCMIMDNYQLADDFIKLIHKVDSYSEDAIQEIMLHYGSLVSEDEPAGINFYLEMLGNGQIAESSQKTLADVEDFIKSIGEDSAQA